MKNILNTISMAVLISATAYASGSTSLEAKIKIIDEQIRNEEQKQEHNAKKLQELVAEYNKLVQERASFGETKGDSNKTEQTHEEAMVQRLKEHERRIDELEKIVASLTGNKPISTDPATNQAASASITSATTTTKTAEKIDKHAADNLATEKAEMGPTPTFDTKSPALAQFNQAMALFNAGIKTGSKTDLKNAAEAFELITKTYPDETYANKAFVHGGDAHLKLGNTDEAQKCYKVAITKPLDRQNAIRARLGYGETLIAKNNKTDACSQIKVLLKETLDDEQKKRFEALTAAASCGENQKKAA